MNLLFANVPHLLEMKKMLMQQAKENAPGMELDGHKIRVDFSITERAHTPTPGTYMGL